MSIITCSISDYLYNNLCYKPCDTNLYYDNLTDVCYKKYPNYESISGITNTTIPKGSNTINILNETSYAIVDSNHIIINKNHINSTYRIHSVCYIDTYNFYCIGGYNGLLFTLDSNFNNKQDITISSSINIYSIAWSSTKKQICAVGSNNNNAYAIVGKYDEINNSILWNYIYTDTDTIGNSEYTLCNLMENNNTFYMTGQLKSNITSTFIYNRFLDTNFSKTVNTSTIEIHGAIFLAKGICTSPNTIVICGSTTNTYSTPILLYSKNNGTTWSIKIDLDDYKYNGILSNICWSKTLNLYCLNGYNLQKNNLEMKKACIWTSVDLTTWTRRLTFSSAMYSTNVSWLQYFNLFNNKGNFVFTAYNIFNQNYNLYISDNAITWYIVNINYNINYPISNLNKEIVYIDNTNLNSFFLRKNCPLNTTISGDLCLREKVTKKYNQPLNINHNITDLFVNDTIKLSISGYFENPNITYSIDDNNICIIIDTYNGPVLKAINSGKTNINIILSSTHNTYDKTYIIQIIVSKKTINIISTSSSNVNYGSTTNLTVSGPVIFNIPKFITTDITNCSISNNILTGINIGSCNIKGYMDSNYEYNYTETNFNINVLSSSIQGSSLNSDLSSIQGSSLNSDLSSIQGSSLNSDLLLDSKTKVLSLYKDKILNNILNILSEEELTQFEKEIKPIINNIEVTNILSLSFEILKIYLLQYFK